MDTTDDFAAGSGLHGGRRASRGNGRNAAASCSVAPHPDADLLREVRAGDEYAWSRLVGRYERLVFSVALRNGVGPEDAADITQQTFIELLESIDRVRDDERLASWLMTVARRLAWKTARREARQWRVIEPVEPVQDLIEVWERATVLRAALLRLGHGCRQLLEALYFGEGRGSYSEVAALLGRPVGGIGPARARCLQRLRTILGEDATW